MSDKPDIIRYRAVSAGACLSVLVGLDLFLNLFCAGFPLIVYLVVAALGAWLGGALYHPLSRDSGGAQFMRWLGATLAFFSMCGIILQFAWPVNWETKCSWRYCGRAMGPSFLESPFPVGTPSCSAWHKCANEYPFTPAEYNRALERMKRQDCAAP
jgi:hypothetical protein